MADVDMADAPGPASKKASEANGKNTDGKKRFEVKKVKFLAT
jgi:hypothetical protein